MTVRICNERSYESSWWKDLRKVCGVGLESLWFHENIN